MASQIHISNHDHSHDYSLLSMFPRTINQPATGALKSTDSDDLDYIHQYLKSMALESHDKLFEQAKSILEGGSEISETNFPSIAASKSQNETIAAKANQNPQERRPGLGRKRARFSMKPEFSQPTTILEPVFDFDKLSPEEFFDAYEKFENAKKELQRQRGDDMSGLEEVKLPATARRRRPGTSGKKVVYKHHRYSVCPEDDIFSSQESSQHGIPNPSNDVSQHDITFTSAESQEKDVVGSISKVENRVDELFDELLSSQIGSLDGEDAVSFMQDRLQIKPINLDNLCLPDFHDVSRTDVDSLEENVPKMRYALSDIRNLLDGLRSETPGKDKQLLGSPIQPVASPTPPKNPFASLSMLGKHISQSIPSSDPFSPLNIDSFPATSPLVGNLNGQSDQADTRKELSISGKLESLSKDKVTINTAANDPHEVPRGDSNGELLDNNFREPGASVHVRGRDSHDELKADDQCNGINNRAKDDDTCGPDETNVQTCQHNAVEVNAEDVLQEALPFVQLDFNMEESTEMDAQPDGVHNIDGNAEDMQLKGASSEVPGSNVELSEMERLDDNQILRGQDNPSATEDHAEARPSEAPESGPDQQNEEHERVSRKGKSKRKDLSRRQSLAGAGTIWKSDVRRSSRVKHRPLEYWEGETHTSLPTVIGLKYISPTKDEKGQTFTAEGVVQETMPSVLNMEDVTDMDAQPHGLHDIDGNVKDMQLKGASCEVPGSNVEFSEMERLDDNQILLGQDNPPATEDHAEGRPSEAPESGPDQQNEEHKRVSRKAKSKRKDLSRRQSLAGAGTIWKSGVRRSSRVKHRPLEYWKGERVLYGRLHTSLPTVIGLKYISPTKDEKGKIFTVKSYVSDEYKELVELAALH